MADVELSTRGSVIKTAYEGEADTNEFSDADVIKLAGVYGVMSVQENAVAETTTDATPRKIAVFDTDGPENNMTVDSATGNDITADVAGTYIVVAQCSFSGSASDEYHIEIYVDAAASGFEGHRKLGVGGDLGSCSCVGIVALAIGEAVSLYHWSSSGGTSFTANDAQIAIHRI
jgi:hypothetical protein